MSKSIYSGNYTRAFLSKRVSPSDSIEQTFYSESIEVGEGEGCYIYSFKENKLIFSKGMDTFFNVSPEEINIVFLNSVYQEDFTKFVNEYYDRLLLYLYNNNENIKDFSSNLIVKAKGLESSILVNIRILKTDANGNLVSIIGKIKKVDEVRTTNVVQYSLKGISDTNFTDKINFDLDHKLCISEINIDLLELMDAGKSQKEISESLTINEEELTKRISQLLNRFEVNSNEELIKFAKNNFIIPSQFEAFNFN